MATTISTATAPELRRRMMVKMFSSGGALDAHDTQPPLSNKSAAAFA